MQKEQASHGNLELLKPMWHHLAPASPPGTGEVFQISLMTALLNGVYEGTVTYGELHHYGDFGLGTFNDLDGEMVGVDGTFYQLRSNGSATLVNNDQRTPFAVVTFFKPEQKWNVEEAISKVALQAAIETATDSNLFAAVKVTGIFDRISTRTIRQQHKPYPPLTDAAAHQAEHSFEEISGTLVGFRTPSFAQGIGVAGFHLHFLRGDRIAGGHVLDYGLRTGTVEVQILRSFHVELPNSRAFLESPLSGASIDASIKASEG